MMYLNTMYRMKRYQKRYKRLYLHHIMVEDSKRFSKDTFLLAITMILFQRIPLRQGHFHRFTVHGRRYVSILLIPSTQYGWLNGICQGLIRLCLFLTDTRDKSITLVEE